MWTKNFQIFKLGLEKEEELEIKVRHSLDYRESTGITEKKNVYLCFISCAKAFDCMDHNKLWKVLREMGIPEILTCLLRNLYVGQETIVRTLYGITDWFKIQKEYERAVCCHPEHIMRNCWTGWVTSWKQDNGRNINNLRYADDTTLMAESKKELESFLMRVKEEGERAGLRLNIRKKLRSWHLASICIANGRGKCGSSDRFPLLGLQNHCR